MEYDKATGWLIGKEHQGMKAMFTMMNNARLGVGAEGLGTAEAAFQKALTFAMGRKQGKTLTNDTGTIIDHADVRRMLMIMKSKTYASRAICLATAVAIDMSNASKEEFWINRAALLTPIAKSFGTETGIEVSNLGIQIHGGMGFVEETGAAQYWRDVRVTSIYEGTNGIQAADLVFRKLPLEGGQVVDRFLKQIEDLASELASDETLSPIGHGLDEGAAQLRKSAMWLGGRLATEPNDAAAGAALFMRLAGVVIGGFYLGKSAQIAKRILSEPNQSSDFMKDKIVTALFYAEQILPTVTGLSQAITRGADRFYAIPNDRL